MMSGNGMRRAIVSVGIAAAALALASCAPSGESQQQTLSNNEGLRTMVANDRQQIEALQQQIARQGDRISELEHGAGGSAASAPNGGAAPQAVASIAPTPGAAETTAAEGVSPPDAVATPSDSEPGAAPAPEAESSPAPAAEATLAAVEPPPITPAPLPGTSEPAAAVPSSAAPAPTWQAAASAELASSQRDAAAKLYRAGLADMTAGKYQSAFGHFQDMQRRYPKSQLSGSAEYFAGNALYELGQYDKAILQLNDLGSRFPEGRYASAALLREAEAFNKINDPIDARLTLQKLINEHPNAPEGPQAKALLDSLSS
jgi:tol-pal system protein YbgF